MGKASVVKKTIEVTLVLPTLAPRTVTVSKGTTLAELLSQSGVCTSRTTINGRPIEEFVTLNADSTVTVELSLSGTGRDRSWLESVGMVRDTPAYREMIASGRAIREHEKDDSNRSVEVDDA